MQLSAAVNVGGQREHAQRPLLTWAQHLQMPGTSAALADQSEHRAKPFWFGFAGAASALQTKIITISSYNSLYKFFSCLPEICIYWAASPYAAYFLIVQSFLVVFTSRSGKSP
ncbi:hypothetical protein CC78DRAFT_579267 [Lojkania enalia]|uniref:Uncharacterized protein n=1 Tax=Lojkania enalia TaxID=147567 RepID=A0A9P4KG63_9PLEO|nr:hypothetical protein CC78DRAFT_579267 [Didymosphaeria enalia]